MNMDVAVNFEKGISPFPKFPPTLAVASSH
jgi:hypothetical protein